MLGSVNLTVIVGLDIGMDKGILEYEVFLVVSMWRMLSCGEYKVEVPPY